MTRFPSRSLQEREINLTDSIVGREEKLRKDLIDGLDAFVVGQYAAKNALIDTILAGFFNVCRDQGALGAVFISGPTGVGKTELIRALSYVLLGDAHAFTKIKAETMSHPADISQLIGSGAGYIGYGDTPNLADIRVHQGYKKAKEDKKLHPMLRDNYNAENFSIILVDEVEKAHPDIPNAFLNALQSGQMEMASGKESGGKILHSKITDLSNTLFVFTSNVGEHSIANSKQRTIGFGTHMKSDTSGDEEVFQKELRRAFAPEFLGRMDAIVRCHALSEDQIREAFGLHTTRMNNLLAQKKYGNALRIEATQRYVDNALLSGKGAEYGARAITTVIKHIGSQVGLALQSGKLSSEANGVLEFDIKNGQPSIKFRMSGNDKQEVGNTQRKLGTIVVGESVRDIIEGKLAHYGDRVRKTTQAYIDLVTSYDIGFADIYKIYERRLLGYGFTRREIEDLKSMAYIQLYQNVEQPAQYEIIMRDKNMFDPVDFRVIEKLLRNAIRKNFDIGRIYRHIGYILERPITKEEGIVTGSYKILHMGLYSLEDFFRNGSRRNLSKDSTIC